MKLQALSAALAAPLLVAGTLVVHGSPLGEDDSDLRTLVQQQAAELSELRVELTETRDLVDMTLTYLDTQSKAAKALEATLGDSESQGFTAGINAKSRETLLKGWRSYLGDQQKGVPGQKAEAPAKGKR